MLFWCLYPWPFLSITTIVNDNRNIVKPQNGLALFNSPSASGHPLRHFELPSGRYLPKAEPVGPAQADYQTAETAVRSETVVGAGDIAFRRCRTGSNGLLDDRPIQSRGIHDGNLPRPPAKGGPDASQRTRPNLILPKQSQSSLSNYRDPRFVDIT